MDRSFCVVLYFVNCCFFVHDNPHFGVPCVIVTGRTLSGCDPIKLKILYHKNASLGTVPVSPGTVRRTVRTRLPVTDKKAHKKREIPRDPSREISLFSINRFFIFSRFNF